MSWRAAPCSWCDAAREGRWLISSVWAEGYCYLCQRYIKAAYGNWIPTLILCRRHIQWHGSFYFKEKKKSLFISSVNIKRKFYGAKIVPFNKVLLWPVQCSWFNWITLKSWTNFTCIILFWQQEFKLNAQAQCKQHPSCILPVAHRGALRHRRWNHVSSKPKNFTWFWIPTNRELNFSVSHQK